MLRVELKDLIKIKFEGVDPKLFEILTGTSLADATAAKVFGIHLAGSHPDAEVVAQVYALTAAAGLHLSTTLIQAALYQDDDAHEDCSLTACLNPLHPGPCKGWKGTLHEVSPGAWHALEAARVEKANHKRIQKIEALKAQGKPIPHKLLQPIVVKPNPNAGQTANKATGEAHAAGQAVTDAAGVKTSTPGKVTLGQAVKAMGPVEKGPKGKKPTLGSKGIAFVIAQEKVTPQYKLDKAAAITPEQWKGLSEADQSTIRGELAKIKKDGFGPQQKKADELLAKLPAGAQPAAPTPVEKIQQANAAHQKAQAEAVAKAAPLKLLPEPSKQLEPKPNVKTGIEKAAADAAAAKQATPAVAAHHVPKTPGEPLSAKNYTPAMKDATDAAGNFANPPKIHALQMTFAERFKAYQKVNAEEWKALPEGTKTAIVHDMVNAAAADSQLHQGFIDESGKAYTPASAWLKRRNIELPALDQGKIDKFVPQFAKGKPTKPTVQTVIPEKTTVEAKNIFGEHSQITKVSHPKYGEAKNQLGDTGSKLPDAASPTGAPKISEGGDYLTPLNVTKIINKDGSAHLFLGGKTVEVGFHGQGKEGTLTFVPGMGTGTGHYVVTTKDGEKYQIGKGENVKVLPKPADNPIAEAKAAAKEAPKVTAADKPKELPKHVQDAIAMANGQAVGASWSKNHLAAYQPLSAEEFAGLPSDTQGKILAELDKATTKFLDPKKVTAAKELIDKFKAAQKPSAAKIENVQFVAHLHDHNVTPAQAKEAAAGVPKGTLFLAAKQTAGLTDVDNPDGPQHVDTALKYGQAMVDLKTKYLSEATLNQPGVKAAMNDLKTKAGDEALLRSIQMSKEHALSKINLTIANKSDQLSPMELAGLKAYRQHLTDHPIHTDAYSLLQAKKKATAAEDALVEKLQVALKQANNPGVDSMSNAQIADKAKELLGPLAGDVKPNLSLAEMQYEKKMAVHQAYKTTASYPADVLNQPAVAAKADAFINALTQVKATQEMQHKVDDHLKQLHEDAIKTGYGLDGPLTAEDKQILAKHAEIIKADWAHLKTSLKGQQAKAIEAQDQFIAAAQKAHAGPVPAVELSDYDKQTIGEVYTNVWSSAASKAVTYGLKTYTQKEQMKAHPDYPAFTQDLGDLKALSGKLALAHAEEHTAELNVPTDPDTGGMDLKSTEWSDWQQKIANRVSVEKQFSMRLKSAQAKLDTIRTAAGLNKRALPKIDSPAVKTGAAEKAYYKTATYGGPLYGKSASAKQYLLAKVGPKIAGAHQTSSDKKMAAMGIPAKPKPAAYVAPPTSQPTKDKFPSKHQVSSGTPNATDAAKYGFTHVDQVKGKGHGWPFAGDPAYVASPDAAAEVEGYLANPDLKHGIEAQKQFKWSINNMVGKGASTSGKDALYNYTGTSYQSINSKLNSLLPGAKKTGSTNISSIDAAMAASPPLESDVVLFRGFGDPHGVFKSGKWNDVNVAGMEWSQRSYSSTSGVLSTAQSFGYGGVVMRIIVPKEMQVHGINAKGGMHPGENEIILQRGLRYKVVADYGKSGNTRYIDVMVVPNPYDQAE